MYLTIIQFSFNFCRSKNVNTKMYKIGDDRLSYILPTHVVINRVKYNIKRKVHLHRIIDGTNQIVLVSFPSDPDIDHNNIRMFGEEYAIQGQQEYRTSFVIHAHILKNHVFEAASEERVSIRYHEDFVDKEDVKYPYQNFQDADVRPVPIPMEKIRANVLKAIANAVIRKKTSIVPFELQRIPIYIVQSLGLQYSDPVTLIDFVNLLNWQSIDTIAASFYGPVNIGLGELIDRNYVPLPVSAYEQPRTTFYHNMNYKGRHDFLADMPMQYYSDYQKEPPSVSSIRPVEEAEASGFETY